MKKAELVFIPSPGMGHLVSTVELAKLLIDRGEQLSITVLIMKLPFDKKVSSYTSMLSESSDSRIRFLDLKPEESSSQLTFSSTFLYHFIDNHKSSVRDILAEMSNSASSNLAGVVIDMFCTSMIDVANEFGVPSYIFYTSGAAMLGLVLHMQSLRADFNEDVTNYKNSDIELAIPTYINPVPAKVLPSVIFDKDAGCDMFLNQAKRYKETNQALADLR